MVAEQISPELALVCPELRAKAIAALPEQPWFAVRPERAEARIAGAVVAASTPARRSAPDRGTMARAAGAYVLARAAGLLAIMGAIVLLVLVLADVAGAVRG